MANRLTPRQERFALNLFQGMTQREAWIQAGYSAKFRPEWVDAHACRLANSVKIMSRIEELRAPLEHEIVLNVLEKREFYAEVKRNHHEATRLRLHATDLDSKLARHYAEPIQFQDNRKYLIIMPSEKGKDLMQRFLAGQLRPEIPEEIKREEATE